MERMITVEAYAEKITALVEQGEMLAAMVNLLASPVGEIRSTIIDHVSDEIIPACSGYAFWGRIIERLEDKEEIWMLKDGTLVAPWLTVITLSSLVQELESENIGVKGRVVEIGAIHGVPNHHLH